MALSIATKFTEIIRCEKDDYYHTDVKNVFILKNGNKDTLNIIQSKQKILIDILINNYSNKVVQFNNDDEYDLSFIIGKKKGLHLSYPIYNGKLNAYRFSTDGDFNFVAVEISMSIKHHPPFNEVILDIIKAHYDINNDDEYDLTVHLTKHEERNV